MGTELKASAGVTGSGGLFQRVPAARAAEKQASIRHRLQAGPHTRRESGSALSSMLN